MNDELLHSYFDDELTPEQRARLEADPSFAVEIARLRELDSALSTLPACIPSPGFAERVVEAARRGKRGLLLRFAIPLAAAAALLLVAFWPQTAAQGVRGAEGFDLSEHLEYVWEADVDTFGSLALNDSALEAQILAELRST